MSELDPDFYPPGSLGYERRRLRLEMRALCDVDNRTWITRWWWRRQLAKFEAMDAYLDAAYHLDRMKDD